MIAHRIQLLPNDEARTYFMKACGVARFAWNWGLARWEEQYRAGEKPNALDLKKTIQGHHRSRMAVDAGNNLLKIQNRPMFYN